MTSSLLKWQLLGLFSGGGRAAAAAAVEFEVYHDDRGRSRAQNVRLIA